MDDAAYLVFALMGTVGLPQVLAFAAAKGLRRIDPRMLSWPLLASAFLGIEGSVLWFRMNPPAGAPAGACGAAGVIFVLTILIVPLNLMLGCLFRAVHLDCVDRQANARRRVC